MSESSVHIPTAHEQAVEKQAHTGHTLSQYVAILSAIVACFAAVISYQSSSKESQAILMKNEAIMKTTQTGDAWAEYQAVRVKARVLEVALASSKFDPVTKAKFKHDLDRYYEFSDPLQKKAEILEQQAAKANAVANKFWGPHQKFAQSMIFLQIAISLASVAALTRKRWLFGVSIVSAVMGTVFAVLGWLA